MCLLGSGELVSEIVVLGAVVAALGLSQAAVLDAVYTTLEEARRSVTCDYDAVQTCDHWTRHVFHAALLAAFFLSLIHI